MGSPVATVRAPSYSWLDPDEIQESKWPVDIKRMAQQEDFVLDTHRYVLWIGGRGCAKTASGSFKLLQYIQEWPGCRCVVIAPTYPQLKATTLTTFTDWLPDEWIVGRNLSPDSMYLDIQPPDSEVPSRVYFRSSTNPDSFRGMEVAYSWIDEVADVQEETIDILTPCHRQKGYPYQTVLTGTPRGFNWVYRRFIDPETRIPAIRGRPRAKAYFARSMDNPFLPPDYVLDLEAQYSGNQALFQQEVLGRFVSFEGLVFPNFSREVHVQRLPADIIFTSYQGGTDFGLSDPSCCLLSGTDDSGRVWVFREFYQRHADGSQFLALHGEWQEEMGDRFGYFFGDPHFPTELATMQASGIRISKGFAQLETGIRYMGQLLDNKPGGPGLMITPDCPNLIREMLSYCHVPYSRGSERYSDTIAKKQDDHAIDALRYMLMGVSSGVGQTVSDCKEVIFG